MKTKHKHPGDRDQASSHNIEIGMTVTVETNYGEANHGVIRRREPKPAPPCRVTLSVAVDPDIRKELNRLAFELNTPVRELVEDAIRQLIVDHQ